MRNIVYLGIVDGILDRLNLDDFGSVKDDGRVFTNEDTWAFAFDEDLKELETKFHGINIENKDVVDWACYWCNDYRINSMKSIDFDQIVDHSEFSEAIAGKTKNLTREEVEALDIPKLTTNTVKELIILNLKKYVVQLSEELKA